MTRTGSRTDYAHRHNFRVEFDGNEITGGFQEVSGLEYSYEVVEYREGGDHMVTKKFRGHARAGNIILRRGVLVGHPDASDLRNWLNRAHASGPGVSRRNGSIIVLDDAGGEVRRWNFTRMWPVRWQGPELNTAASREVAITELELAVETINLVTETGSSGD
jgi:phage tail-like protein